MKFVDLSGRIHSKNIKPSDYPIRPISKSAGQKKLGEAIQRIFPPSMGIMEEYPCWGEQLYLDFFIPGLMMAFEFNGSQHDEFNPFFHGDRSGFANEQRRDQRKAKWCELNKIRLITLSDIDLENLEEVIKRSSI